MSPRTPWVLATACVALGAALFLLETRSATPAQAARTALVPLTAAQTTRVELEWPGARAVLERHEDRWWLERSGRARQRAASSVVEAALAELELLSRGGEVRGAAPGAAHGLAPPRLKVTVEGGGRRSTISFGAAAAWRRVYASSKGRLYLVDARALSRWGTGPEDLVDRRLVHFDPETARRVEVAGTSLERRRRRWYLARPAGARADPDRVRALLDTLRSLRTVAPGSASAIAVTVVDEKGRHLGKGPIRAEARGELDKLLQRLPDHRPVRLPSAWIQSFEIRAGDRALRLKRSEDGWRLPDGAAAEDRAINALLGALNRLEAREILGPEAAGLAEPVQLVLSWESPAGSDGLRLGPARGKRRAARFSSEDTVYVFPEGRWARVRPDPLDWRRRLAWDLPAASIEAIAVDGDEIRRDERFRWRRPRPGGKPLVHAEAERLARLLARPRVRRFLDRPLPRRSGVLRVETIDGDRRTWHTMRMGPKAPGGGRYARVDGRTLILDDALWKEALRVVRPAD